MTVSQFVDFGDERCQSLAQRLFVAAGGGEFERRRVVLRLAPPQDSGESKRGGHERRPSTKRISSRRHASTVDASSTSCRKNRLISACSANPASTCA